MSNKLVWLLCLVVGLCIGHILPHKVNPTYTIPTHDTIWYKVDSIQTIVDTLEVTKTQIIHVYETKESIINNNSCADDYEYFSEFLRARFSNSDNR